ncbi:hypothetical protein COCVIDRAFT_11556 [Bipolaris victoriae FI3]|uniref:Uncharacterized protein n=1 Tax=Bipolaris victoriae (strain FI3) TaxID=930091 RepID=W7EZC6_BIPV3|nr:hypothetical protein COCVIDRAFT_11556 [Bipolaris victoriae FI3]
MFWSATIYYTSFGVNSYTLPWLFTFTGCLLSCLRHLYPVLYLVPLYSPPTSSKPDRVTLKSNLNPKRVRYGKTARKWRVGVALLRNFVVHLVSDNNILVTVYYLVLPLFFVVILIELKDGVKIQAY